MPEAVRHLPAGIDRSPLQDHGVPLDVASHHRTVPDDCVFSFQSALKEQNTFIRPWALRSEVCPFTPPIAELFRILGAKVFEFLKKVFSYVFLSCREIHQAHLQSPVLYGLCRSDT